MTLLVSLVLLSATQAGPTSWQQYLEAGLALLLLLNILFTVIVWMMGMVQAWQGRSYQLPFVGHWSEQIVTRTDPTFTRRDLRWRVNRPQRRLTYGMHHWPV